MSQLGYTWRNTKSLRTAHAQQPGQALVELALSITLIFFLVAAAIDLGLAFKTYQTLVNATAEASTYLSINPKLNCAVSSCPNGNAFVAADQVARQRFRTEQGDTVRGIASTLDLNSNGINDQQEGLPLSNWIEIWVADNTQLANGSYLNGTNSSNQDCRNRVVPSDPTQSCYIVVRTRMIYRPFILRPVLGSEMTISTVSVRDVVHP